MLVASVALLVIVVGSEVSGYTHTSLCGPNDFPCDDGTCIDKSRWCDSAHDCQDDSDEEYCYKITTNSLDPNRCKDNFFRCKDGPCIPRVGRCDGYVSCHDQSDEHDCGKGPTTFAPAKMVINFTRQATTVQQHPTEWHPTDFPHFSKSIEEYSFYNRTLDHEIILNTEFQSDSVAPKIEKTDVDITKGFEAVDKHYFIHEKSQAEAWLLSTRDDEFGWGEDTARAVTALYLSDPDLLRNKTNNILMSIQLHLKISVAMIRNQTKEMTLSELSSYINALHALCDNPRNFHGLDLVETLKQRTKIAQRSNKIVNPSVYLTLCISGATTSDDVRIIQEMLFGTLRVDKIDVQALVSLAASCISNIPEFSNHFKKHNARRMFNMVKERGLPDNIYELALVIQALSEAKVNQDLWNRSDALHKVSAIQFQDGSFGDVLATYYALPVLAGKSLVGLSKHCYNDQEKGMVPVEVLLNGKERKDFVQYSLYFGDPVEVTQSLRIRVGESSSLFDVMRIAAATNPIYRFRFDASRGKPYVYSIGGVVNDAEKGLYWTLEISSRKNSIDSEKLITYNGDIRSYFPSASDHVVFWLKYLF